jgi:hypothetical protein
LKSVGPDIKALLIGPFFLFRLGERVGVEKDGAEKEGVEKDGILDEPPPVRFFLAGAMVSMIYQGMSSGAHQL